MDGGEHTDINDGVPFAVTVLCEEIPEIAKVSSYTIYYVYDHNEQEASLLIPKVHTLPKRSHFKRSGSPTLSEVINYHGKAHTVRQYVDFLVHPDIKLCTDSNGLLRKRSNTYGALKTIVLK